MSLKTLVLAHRSSLIQLIQFGLVGGAGVVVNETVLVLSNVVGRDLFGAGETDVFFPVPFTAFNVRNYHLYVMFAFLVANFFNFMLNRNWTFKSVGKVAIWREYFPFLLVGLGAQLVGLLLITALLNPTSPICLPDAVFDGSSGLRNKLYWANLIIIVAVTPINFVLNKLWTFRAVRRKHRTPSA
ncbi:MAG: GtrA family protein [Propionibacteriaceae bacterium]|jgi:putative flippase GtrA|nr:GtrA family protein [Propionibacteriaceae bacterium]